MLERRSSLERSHAGRGLSRRLSERRRKRRQWLSVAAGILVLVLFGATIWGFWQSSVRISSVTISGGDDAIGAVAKESMRGTYFHLVPRNSAFFYSGTAIRKAILAADPGIAAVSIRRKGATELRIIITDRVALARWCGAEDAGSFKQCYVFDPSGFVFATTSPLTRSAGIFASSTASSSAPLQAAAVALAPAPSTVFRPLDPYVIYEPLASSTNGPIGATLPNANAFPDVFSFAQQVAAFGAEVRSIHLKNGEVDDMLSSGTVVKYVLGEESQALSALNAAKANFNLADGSIEYVDLRFSGKVYVKKIQNK